MFLAGSNAANCNLKHSGWRCGEYAYSPGDWELFGIDFMFDADFKPWVLEVRERFFLSFFQDLFVERFWFILGRRRREGKRILLSRSSGGKKKLLTFLLFLLELAAAASEKSKKEKKTHSLSLPPLPPPLPHDHSTHQKPNKHSQVNASPAIKRRAFWNSDYSEYPPESDYATLGREYDAQNAAVVDAYARLLQETTVRSAWKRPGCTARACSPYTEGACSPESKECKTEAEMARKVGFVPLFGDDPSPRAEMAGKEMKA